MRKLREQREEAARTLIEGANPPTALRFTDYDMYNAWREEEQATASTAYWYSHRAFGVGREAGGLMMGAWMAAQLGKPELDRRLMKGILPSFELHFRLVPPEERESEFWEFYKMGATTILKEALEHPQFEDVSDRRASFSKFH
ncbi:hypothetical protein E8E11_011876 [Didymella keratinophila]|nr:hypothetical protein E8E11_011876 [Didymella keratinophila]